MIVFGYLRYIYCSLCIYFIFIFILLAYKKSRTNHTHYCMKSKINFLKPYLRKNVLFVITSSAQGYFFNQFLMCIVVPCMEVTCTDFHQYLNSHTGAGQLYYLCIYCCCFSNFNKSQENRTFIFCSKATFISLQFIVAYTCI